MNLKNVFYLTVTLSSLVANPSFGTSKDEITEYSLPHFSQTYKKPNHESSLDYFKISINNEIKFIKENQIVDFIKGDSIEIHEAYLNNKSIPVDLVNLVGFRAKNANSNIDDRGHNINTKYSLSNRQRKWSIDDEGRVFCILAVSNEGILHGSILLRRNEPKLKFVQLKINNRLKTVRPGQIIRMKPDDLFKVEKVVTNLPSVKDIGVKIISLKKSPFSSDENSEYYEFQFARNNYIFATLPFLMEAK